MFSIKNVAINKKIQKNKIAHQRVYIYIYTCPLGQRNLNTSLVSDPFLLYRI